MLENVKRRDNEAVDERLRFEELSEPKDVKRL
jgi:hypothetical protein